MDFACVSFFAGNQEKSCTTFKELPSWGYNHITFFTSLLHTLINCKFLFYWVLIKHRFTCMFSWMVVNKQWEHQVYCQLGDHNRLKNIKKKDVKFSEFAWCQQREQFSEQQLKLFDFLLFIKLTGY